MQMGSEGESEMGGARRLRCFGWTAMVLVCPRILPQ